MVKCENTDLALLPNILALGYHVKFVTMVIQS